MTSTNIISISALLSLSIACADSALATPCDGIDPVLSASSFVLVVTPTEGLRTASPVLVRGCSRTSESNVVWELRGRDGRVLGSGHTSGGGFSGLAAFEFSAEFTVSEPEVGQLEVSEVDDSDGEGFPPSRTILPLVLIP